MKHAGFGKSTAFGTVAVVLALIFALSSCFSPLQGVNEGNLAVRVSFPDGIHAMESESLVGRLYVINAAYEGLLRTVLAYEDFLDVFYYDVPISAFNDYPILLQAFLRLEEFLDKREEELILKAPVMFGGKPYFDFNVNDPRGGGSVTPPGVPADRAYFVYLDMWNPGEQDQDDADPVFESVAWDESDPYEDLLSEFGDASPGDRLSMLGGTPLEIFNGAESLFNDVRAAYRDREAYPFISAAFVPRGGTAEITLQMREFPSTGD
ncbi:MAG: hypothetical protein EA403_00195 [Spirochaetaceae bacterium]|nr:MAG: hypothetical protein EA403_00195 [Spirochaetaceae bacterium]